MFTLRPVALLVAVALLSGGGIAASAAELSATATQTCAPRPEFRATTNVDDRGRATVALRTDGVLLCRYNVTGSLTRTTLLNSARSAGGSTPRGLLARLQGQRVVPNNRQWACTANVGPSWTVHFLTGQNERLAIAVDAAGCAFANPYRVRDLPVRAQQLPVRFASREFITELRQLTRG